MRAAWTIIAASLHTTMINGTEAATITNSTCYHCGAQQGDEAVMFDDKFFCCPGCKLVYELLYENNLCKYYALDHAPGRTRSGVSTGMTEERFAWLDEPEIAERLINYRDDKQAQIDLHLPTIHCSSCIWLLEHLRRLDGGVISSSINFLERRILIVFDTSITSVRKLVELLDSIGYPPVLSLNELDKAPTKKKKNTRIYRIGVAGFAFGNIMLLSFPDYLGIGADPGQNLSSVFGYLSLLLSLPVFFFSAGEFLSNLFFSIRQRSINIDVPIAIGIIAMFGRSCYEIISGSGPGYLDSMTGLVFFMLIGRNFQHKSYEWLSFERDYKSYFPIAVSRYNKSVPEPVTVTEIRINDRLLIRNGEIIPADVMLLSETAAVDYSFVTGESRPIHLKKGDRIYAGGRLTGTPADVLVMREVTQSYLTRLWNREANPGEKESSYQRMTSEISRWFVIITFLTALASFSFWYGTDHLRAVNAFTSVLVIACACALALSAPFTYGNMLRILGKSGIYLKNTGTIERLADIDIVLFDKTGTLTGQSAHSSAFTGEPLSADEMKDIGALCMASSHPLSRLLGEQLQPLYGDVNPKEVKEWPGEGIEGWSGSRHIRIGKPSFTGADESTLTAGTLVGIQINGKHRGIFLFRLKFRPDTEEMIRELKQYHIDVAMSSGDRDTDRPYMEKLLGKNAIIRFQQLPPQKMELVKELQETGKKVMMIGDGLNDAGALLESHVGLALTENVNNFSPGCDGIIPASAFGKTAQLIRFARSGKAIIIASFILSLLYNAAGLWFAVQGTLSPVIAAILMPISTSSLVAFTVLSSTVAARSYGLNKKQMT